MADLLIPVRSTVTEAEIKRLSKLLRDKLTTRYSECWPDTRDKPQEQIAGVVVLTGVLVGLL